MTRTRLTRIRRAVALAAILAVTAAACGDSDSDSDSEGQGVEPPGTTADAGEAVADGVAEAEAILLELVERPTEITNNVPIDAEIPSDKTIAWVQCPAPSCIQLAEPLRQGAEALGWTLQILQHDGSPESVKAMYQEAITAGVDGVVSSGYPRVVFEEEMQQFKEAGVPVVQLTVADEPGDGLTAVVNGPARNAQVGAQLAAAVVADSVGEANVLWVTAPYPVLVPELEGLAGEGGFEPEVNRLCESCSVSVLDIPADAIGADGPARIVAHLQANPDINYVVGAFSDLVFGLPGALSDAGLEEVQVTTYIQSPAMSAALEQGEVQAVVGFPGPEDTWQAIDVLARVFAGVEFDGDYSDLPSWVLTSDNIPSTTEDFPLVEDYQAQYKVLWGVS